MGASAWRARGLTWGLAALAAGGCVDEGPTAPPETGGPGPELAGSWSTAAPLPEPLSDAGVAVLSGRIHVVAGLGADEGEPSPRAYRYDPVANAWQPIADLPEGVVGPAAAVLDGTLYVMGGNASTSGGSARAAVWARDAAVDAWTLHSALPLASFAPVAAATTAGLHVAALGGFALPPGDSTALLPPGSRVWRSAAPQPFRPDWLLGDGDGAWAVGPEGIARLDADAGAWDARVALPTEGFVVGAWVLDGRVYLLQRIATRATMRAWDPEAGAWEILAPPAEAIQRRDAMAATLDGRLYLIGGREATPDGAALRRVDVFTPGG